MKTLRTKAVNIVVCWNNLKNVPPKAFPNIQEMEKVPAILGQLEGAIPELVEIVKEGEELNKKIITGEIEKDDSVIARKDWVERSRKIESEIGDEIVEIEFESDDFNTFFQEFERWGKDWFNRVDDFLNFRANMNETNKQPKGKKEEKKDKKESTAEKK